MQSSIFYPFGTVLLSADNTKPTSNGNHFPFELVPRQHNTSQSDSIDSREEKRILNFPEEKVNFWLPNCKLDPVLRRKTRCIVRTNTHSLKTKPISFRSSISFSPVSQPIKLSRLEPATETTYIQLLEGSKDQKVTMDQDQNDDDENPINRGMTDRES